MRKIIKEKKRGDIETKIASIVKRLDRLEKKIDEIEREINILSLTHQRFK